jgi:predicted transposase/invertase (TIGR01784 family)
LSEGENLWLKSLTNDLESGVARVILETGKEASREVSLNAYLDVLLRANPRAFMEAWTMTNDTATFEEVFTKAGIIPQWIERGIEQGIERGIEQGIKQGKEEKALAIARNLLAKGWTAEDVAETTDLPIEKVRSLVVD